MAFRRRSNFRRRTFSKGASRMVWQPTRGVIAISTTAVVTATLGEPSLLTSTGTNQHYAATLLRIRATIAVAADDTAVLEFLHIGIRKRDIAEGDEDPSDVQYATDEDMLFSGVYAIQTDTPLNLVIDVKAKRRFALEEQVVMDMTREGGTGVLATRFHTNCLFKAP